MKKFLCVVLVVVLGILFSVSVFAGGSAQVVDTRPATVVAGQTVNLGALSSCQSNYSDSIIGYDIQSRVLTLKKNGVVLTGAGELYKVQLGSNVTNFTLSNANITATSREPLFGIHGNRDYINKITVIGNNVVTAKDNGYFFTVGRTELFGDGTLTLKGSGNLAPLAYDLKERNFAEIVEEYQNSRCDLIVGCGALIVEDSPLVLNTLMVEDGRVYLYNGARIDFLWLNGGYLFASMTKIPDYTEEEAFTLSVWDRMYFNGGGIKVEPYEGAAGSIRYKGCGLNGATIDILSGEGFVDNSVWADYWNYHTITDTFESVINPAYVPEEEIIESAPAESKPEEKPQESTLEVQDRLNIDDAEKVDYGEVLNVGELVSLKKDVCDKDGRWAYSYVNKRLVIYKTGVCLTGENKSLSIEPTKGASTINIKDLTIDSTGATCACGKSCAICNGKSYPVFQMINVVGKNSITVAEGAVLYWVSDSLELNGNGKVTFIGNNFAFSDPALTVYVSGANVTFTGNTDFKEILVTGGAITLPKGNEEANVINRSADGKLYFSHLGLKTEADFPCVGLSHQGAVLQGGSAATPGENWNISTNIGNKTVSIGLIWVILVPTVSVIIITGLVIALIRKNKKA